MHPKIKAHAKEHLPDRFVMNIIARALHIKSNWDGRFTPVYWLLGIMVTAVGSYIVVYGGIAVLKHLLRRK